MKRFKLKFSARGAAIFGTLILAAVSAAAVYSMAGTGAAADGERLEIVEKAIYRAAVQCYALEGAYPPGIEYLERHYGIMIDHDKYYVHYQTDGSNLKPDIQVFAKFTE